MGARDAERYHQGSGGAQPPKPGGQYSINNLKGFDMHINTNINVRIKTHNYTSINTTVFDVLTNGCGGSLIEKTAKFASHTRSVTLRFLRKMERYLTKKG